MRGLKFFSLIILSTFLTLMGCQQGASPVNGNFSDGPVDPQPGLTTGADQPTGTLVNGQAQGTTKNLDARIKAWADFVDLPSNQISSVKSQIEAAGYTFNQFNPAVVNVLLQFDPNIERLKENFAQANVQAQKSLNFINGTDHANFLTERGMTAEEFQAKIREHNAFVLSLTANFRIFRAYFAKVVSYFYEGIDYVENSDSEAVTESLKDVSVADPTEMLFPYHQLIGSVTFKDGGGLFYTFYQWHTSAVSTGRRDPNQAFIGEATGTGTTGTGRFFVTTASENAFTTATQTVVPIGNIEETPVEFIQPDGAPVQFVDPNNPGDAEAVEVIPANNQNNDVITFPVPDRP